MLYYYIFALYGLTRPLTIRVSLPSKTVPSIFPSYYPEPTIQSVSNIKSTINPFPELLESSPIIVLHIRIFRTKPQHVIGRSKEEEEKKKVFSHDKYHVSILLLNMVCILYILYTSIKSITFDSFYFNSCSTAEFHPAIWIPGKSKYPLANERNYIPRGAICGLFPVRLWIGRKLFGTLGRSGVRISAGRIIKGSCETTELVALKYITEHTSVPLPKVLKVHRYNNRLYIEMEYIRGIDLQAVWLGGHLSQDQKRHIMTEIADYVSQLRSLKPLYEGIVGSADLAACLDHRLGPYTFGPFAGHAEFHSFLRRHVPIENCTRVFGSEVTNCHSRRYQSRFTHADLCPRNIIVDDNGRVSAIIDWEFGGWYPEYWEYTKAHFGQIDMPD